MLTRGVVLYTLRRRVPKPLPLAVAWVCFEIALTGCASALTGRQIATTFDAGVAAYDAGHFDQAYAFWASIDGEDVAAMRNVGVLLRKGQGVKKILEPPRKCSSVPPRPALSLLRPIWPTCC